ncbi:MAG: alpha/beta hydrolase [Silicimonas sp.]|nr:alpha/beta hydrolase [Silicimonas sp.]
MEIVLGLLALLVVLPFVAEALRQRPEPAHAPGQFADLPLGRTHYRWSGPETAPVAVCVHGLSTPSYVFAATESALTTLGYRVLTYDLYGRGFSANPPAAQGARFFNLQLDALLADQRIEARVTLVGYSMGGAIAAAFAAASPDRVRALVLIAPAGLEPVYDDWIGRLWTLPVLGDWATRVLGGIALRRELVEHRTSATVLPDLEDRQARETRRHGYLPAILSSRRNMLRESRSADHRTIARAGIPVLAIWGTDDPVIPLKTMGRLAELNPDAHHRQVAGAGHLVLQSHPAQVSDALRRFLKPR